MASPGGRRKKRRTGFGENDEIMIATHWVTGGSLLGEFKRNLNLTHL